MMRLRTRASTEDELGDERSLAPRPERTGVPLKAQKLLGQKGHLGFNIEESIIISGGSPYAGGGIDVPPKAQKVLGERAKIREVRIQDGKHVDPESFWHVRDAERQRSVGNSDHASYADSDSVPGASKGATLPQYPVALRSSEDVRPSSNGSKSTMPTGASSRATRHRPSAESLNRDYYDSTKQLLLVSQQTSESSVRDVALRKGGALIYDSSSEPCLTTPGSRESGNRLVLADRSVSDGITRKQKKIGLRSLLPHGKSEAQASGGGKFARPPPSSSPASSESFSRDGVQVSRLGSRQSNRQNKFHADIYDNRKTNVRRPPKGIKNWFDGFDISSEDDEDEEATPVELPTTVPSKKAILDPEEALPSVFSLYGPPTRDFTSPTHVNPKILPARGSSLMHNTRATHKHQKTRKNSQSSTTAESASSGNVDGRKRSGESRLARSRLGAQSVLSLSSGSDEQTAPPANRDSVGNSTIVNERANSFDLHRVSTPTDASSRQHGISRAASDGRVRRANSHSTGLRSNHFRDSSTNYNSTPAIPSRESGSMLSAASSRRWQYGWNGYSHHRSNVHSPYERDGGESAGGETSSSVPTDASRLMAVTEEEMILLEVMRQKRAAMQKHSFAEGYRLARRQGEQFHHNRIPDPASDPTLLVLKRRGGSRMTNRGLSRTESLIREELEQRKRLSALRKEEVDKAFKIGRFLEMESPNEDASSMSKLDRFLVMAPGLAGDFSGRPVSGTEIEIDSRYGDNEESQSQFDDEEFQSDEPETEQSTIQSDVEQAEEVEPARTPQPIISPMQRLTDQVRTMTHDAAVAKVQTTASRGRNEMAESTGRSNSEQASDNDDARTDPVKAKSPTLANTNHMSRSRGAPSIQLRSQGLAYEDDQETRIDSPDTPVATTWARPTRLKHPRPQRQQPVLDFTPLEHPTVQSDVPFIPMEETSPTALLANGAAVVGLRTIDDTAATSPQEGRYAVDGDVPNPLRSHPPGNVDPGRSKRVPAPPRIDTKEQGGGSRVTSMANITSAGEDVLAAWAELGGSEFKRKRDW